MSRPFFIFLFFAATALVILQACNDAALPKPSAQLRLDYKIPRYELFSQDCPFLFEVNDMATVTRKAGCDLEIKYPKLKATIYLSYKPISNNITALLKDAQKLTYKHVIKADDIIEQPFLNNPKRVFGMFYDVSGNAATNGQFYATDSLRHFIDCSVYFYTKPNFDSLLPAAAYVKDDMRHLLETLEWR